MGRESVLVVDLAVHNLHGIRNPYQLSPGFHPSPSLKVMPYLIPSLIFLNACSDRFNSIPNCLLPII